MILEKLFSNRFAVFSLALATLALCVAGCGRGRSGPKTVNVSGMVYLDGKPADGVEIEFHGENFVGVGKTNADGRYQLATGAVSGENTILFRKREVSGIEMNPEAGMDMGQVEAMMAGAGGGAGGTVKLQELVPDFYSDIGRTNVKYQVPEGGSDSADFRLDSKAK